VYSRSSSRSPTPPDSTRSWTARPQNLVRLICCSSLWGTSAHQSWILSAQERSAGQPRRTLSGPPLLRRFVGRLRARGSGRVVILFSAVFRVRKANLAHGAAKAGIDGFGRGLADALADSGVG